MASNNIAIVTPKTDITKPAVKAAKPAVTAKPAVKPAVTAKPAVKPAVAAKPAVKPAVTAKPAVKPAVAAKPAVKPAVKPEAPKANTYAIHVNKTGRVCLGKDAAERLGDGFAYCAIKTEGKIVRLEPSKKDIDGAVSICWAGTRPYVSATRQLKPLGFDGSRPYDCEAKPYGTAGFEFRLS